MIVKSPLLLLNQSLGAIARSRADLRVLSAVDVAFFLHCHPDAFPTDNRAALLLIQVAKNTPGKTAKLPKVLGFVLGFALSAGALVGLYPAR